MGGVKLRRNLLDIVGPGFITGASNDEPSGIATFSQAGAMFGYVLGWTMLLTFPLMAGVQYVSSAIGAATGKGLASNLRARYPAWVCYILAALLLIANTVSLGADIGAMGAATQLLVPIQPILLIVVYAVVSVLLISFVHFKNYSRYLKWLCLSLLAYVASAAVVGVDWGSALRGTFIPAFDFSSKSLSIIVAILGTSISPYMVFWEASLEVETLKETPGSRVLKKEPAPGRREMRRLTADNLVGMGVSQLVGLFIIFTCAAALNHHGHTDIETAAEAASALEPVAGNLASLVFAAGIVGTGLLAVPIFAASTAFACGEVFGWRCGLNLNPTEAKAFYGTIAVTTAIGVALNLAHLNVIKFLVGSAIINGIIEVPIIIMMMLLGQNRTIMGEFTISGVWAFLGWLTVAVMGIAVVGMLAIA